MASRSLLSSSQNGAGEELKRHHLLSRTIAILAGVAASTHQLAIQAHITQSGFTILSERSEFWSNETDQDFLQEFLRDEEKRDVWMHRLTGAKIYVMVLERHDAAETWLSLCGPDLEGDKIILGDDGLPLEKTGLRAKYGAGVVYGSSVESAPRQLAICFPDLASVAAMDALHAETDLLATSSSGTLLAQGEECFSSASYGKGAIASPSSIAAPTTIESTFKARPMPSNKQPTIKPRLSKAAALRMGVAIPEPPKRTTSDTSSNDPSLGISGVRRADVALPKSLAAPSIAPRLNKAAAVRTGSMPSTESNPTVKTKKAIDFSNTPGHKRVSLSASRPASLAAPTVAPRLNKAAAARLSGVNGNDATKVSPTIAAVAPPVAARKPIDFSNTPGHKRMSLTTSSIKSLQAPTLAPRANLASQARTSIGGDAIRPVLTTKTVVKAKVPSGKENEIRKPIDFSNTPGHKRPSSSFAISSLNQPTIVPRINTAAKKRLSVGAVAPPSAFKGVPAVQSHRARPASAGANAISAQAKAAALRVSRPASRSSISGAAHQDGTFPRANIRARAAPPSSFRM